MQDFAKLATFLPRRSTRDCIAFYYRTQKEDDWALVKRKLKLKKRRLQSEQNRTYLSGPAFGRFDPRDSFGGAAGACPACSKAARCLPVGADEQPPSSAHLTCRAQPYVTLLPAIASLQGTFLCSLHAADVSFCDAGLPSMRAAAVAAAAAADTPVSKVRVTRTVVSRRPSRHGSGLGSLPDTPRGSVRCAHMLPARHHYVPEQQQQQHINLYVNAAVPRCPASSGSCLQPSSKTETDG